MAKSKNKVHLSPQLKLGVGRGYSKNNILKYSGFVFLFVSLALAGWTVYTIVKHTDQTPNEANPQVLGASDKQSEPFINYTVQKGDTIFNIAQKYNINWTTLATINNLASPFTLKVGQTLKIPNQ
jgi:hypothetical protein